MHQETAPDPYKLQYFSFGYLAPPEPSKQDAIWPLNNTGAFGIEPAFKQEEIDTMHQHLEQRSNGGQELLHLMVRTDDSVVMSQCMDKCSFSSTPSFAMDSTNSTQQLFLLDMSNEQVPYRSCHLQKAGWGYHSVPGSRKNPHSCR